jgi:hypothetical protein
MWHDFRLAFGFKIPLRCVTFDYGSFLYQYCINP